MKKSTKWALIAVSCSLLASLARACAPEYDQTNAYQTNNQASSYGYVEQVECVMNQVGVEDELLVEEITSLRK